ncbi:MAG TPA: rhodanese-like domain-containing protein [Azospirillum sp.]
MPMKMGYKDLLAEANARIQVIAPQDALALHGSPDVVFVDIRDVRELQREGMIPGAFHAPRGMLEFWVDPDSPYHKPVFASGKRFIFYCASAWRSALATDVVQRMGLEPVCHLQGGFKAWKEAGLPVAPMPEKDAH